MELKLGVIVVIISVLVVWNTYDVIKLKKQVKQYHSEQKEVK